MTEYTPEELFDQFVEESEEETQETLMTEGTAMSRFFKLRQPNGFLEVLPVQDRPRFRSIYLACRTH